MSDLVQKWELTGLLEGLDSAKHEGAAAYLNKVALKLISLSPKEDGPAKRRMEQIAGMVIPLARRVFEKYPNHIEPEVLVEDFSQFFDENQPLLKDLTDLSCIALDGEMEFSSMFEWRLREKLGIKHDIIIN